MQDRKDSIYNMLFICFPDQQMAQELGINEKSPDYKNPFKDEDDDVSTVIIVCFSIVRYFLLLFFYYFPSGYL